MGNWGIRDLGTWGIPYLPTPYLSQHLTRVKRTVLDRPSPLPRLRGSLRERSYARYPISPSPRQAFVVERYALLLLKSKRYETQERY